MNNAFVQPPLKRIEYDDIEEWRRSHEVNVIVLHRVVHDANPELEEGDGPPEPHAPLEPV